MSKKKPKKEESIEDKMIMVEKSNPQFVKWLRDKKPKAKKPFTKAKG